MMTLEVNLPHLRELFRHEWQQVTIVRLGRPVPVPYFSNDLLRLMAQEHTRPVRNLESAVRTIVRDACSVGNASVAEHHDLDMILQVLERVRQQAVRTGEWGEQASALPMYG